MDRGLPCGSKLCARRAEQRRLELHRTRIRNVRPLVDTSEPVVSNMDHVRSNLKREQMLEERYSEIDRENRILLKKMSDIMKQPVNSPASPRPTGPQSLNRDARKKELLRITKDNQSILRRIQQAQPVYNHVEWDGVNRRNLSYLKNCTEFPLVLRSARGRPSELVPLAGAVPQERPQSARSSRVPPTDEEDSLDPHGTDVAYVLKEGRMIGGTYYLVEMVTDGRSLSITAYNGETKTSLELVLKEIPDSAGSNDGHELLQGDVGSMLDNQDRDDGASAPDYKHTETEFRRLYREAKGDYSELARRLAVEGNKLVLDEGPSAPTEMDAEAMVVQSAKSGSAGSVNAEISLGGSGEAQVRLRGLTPSSAATTQATPRRPPDRSG